MKKFLIYLTIFVAVFLGTATCIVVNGYNSYQTNKNNEIKASDNNPNSTVLTNLASNVLNAEQFGGIFNLSDNETINIDGTFAIQNKNTQIIDITLKGNCGTFDINADIQYFNNYIYINFNDTKIKLSAEDISTSLEAIELAISSISDTVESSSSSKLPELDTDYLMQFLDKIVTTETPNGTLIQLSIPDLCSLYLMADNNNLPTQILVNNISVGSNSFTLNIQCDSAIIPSTINPDEYMIVTPILEYIKPTLLTLNENSLGISGQIDINGNMLFIDATLKNKNKLSGKINFSNITANFEFKNDYLLVEIYKKVFKITLDDIPQLLNNLNSSEVYTAKSTTTQKTQPNLTPTIKNGKLTRLDIKSDQIMASFDFGKSYFDAISIDETNTKSLNDLISTINNFKSIIANEYSLNISFTQNNISIDGNIYVAHENLKLTKLYFSGSILNTHTTIIYEDLCAYINIDGLKFKLSNQSIENIFNIAISAITKDQSNINQINLSSLDALNIINDIDFSPRQISFNSNNISAKITAYTGFFKAQVIASDITINSTINVSSAYKSIAKNIDKNTFKDYSELSDLLSATINTLNNNQIHYKGSVNLDLFDTNVKNIGIDVEIFKNEKRVEIKLTNLPNNSILTYLSSIYYVGQNCHLTITENYVHIYTTTIVRLTGREVVVANKTVPLNEFSVANLYDIMCLRKVYIDMLSSSASGNSTPSINFTTDMLDINNNETILTLTKFVESFASELTVKIQHINSIEKVSAFLNIHEYIKFEINLTKIN